MSVWRFTVNRRIWATSVYSVQAPDEATEAEVRTVFEQHLREHDRELPDRGWHADHEEDFYWEENGDPDVRVTPGGDESFCGIHLGNEPYPRETIGQPAVQPFMSWRGDLWVVYARGAARAGGPYPLATNDEWKDEVTSTDLEAVIGSWGSPSEEGTLIGERVEVGGQPYSVQAEVAIMVRHADRILAARGRAGALLELGKDGIVFAYVVVSNADD